MSALPESNLHAPFIYLVVQEAKSEVVWIGGVGLTLAGRGGTAIVSLETGCLVELGGLPRISALFCGFENRWVPMRRLDHFRDLRIFRGRDFRSKQDTELESCCKRRT